jgi:hypothetical protein
MLKAVNTENELTYAFNYYFGPMEIGSIPKISIQLPYRYLNYSNSTIKIGKYEDYLWAREERLKSLIEPVK